MLQNVNQQILTWVEFTAVVMEVLAVAVIVLAMLYFTVRFLLKATLQRHESWYEKLRSGLGRSLILGLEFLLAADVVRTVALDATLESVAVLGLLVLIRTFLSWALIVEIEGRWPWQAHRANVRPSRD